MPPCLLLLALLAVTPDVPAPPPAPFVTQVSNIKSTSMAAGASHFQIFLDHIYIIVRAEGRPMCFCVDTGASRSLMEPESARGLIDGNMYHDHVLRGYGGDVTSSQRTRELSFNLPGAACRTSMIVVKSGISSVPSAWGLGDVPLHSDGIIGLDILSHFRVCIDYAAQTITFAPPGDGPTPRGLSFPAKTHRLYIPVTLNGKDGSKSGQMLFDTGASGNANIYHSVESVSFDDLGTTTQYAVGGALLTRHVRIASMDVGGFNFNNVVADVDQANASGVPQVESLDGNLLGGIGGGILHHFRITLDLPNHLYYMEQNDAVEMPGNAVEPSLADVGELYPSTPENVQKMQKNLMVLRAARQGNAQAAEYVGVAFATGRGIPQDYNQAAYWLRIAAAREGHVAAYVLGLLYEQGYGVPPNPAKAVSYYSQAARQQDHYAEYALGRQFETGNGIPADLSAARSWYQKAAIGGLPVAKIALARLSGTPFEAISPFPQKAPPAPPAPKSAPTPGP